MTVTRFAFKLADGDNYIDLAQCLSLVQRTMVRQKQTFTVLGGQVVDNVGGDGTNTTASIKISTAPNFWYIRAAINRCFKAWKDQRSRTLQNAELDGVKNATAKFSDFKITLNGVGSASNVLPVSTGQAVLQEFGSHSGAPSFGEWATASVISEEPIMIAGAPQTEFHFKILGDHTATYYSATKGWLVTRALPDTEFEPDMLDLDGNAVLDYKEDALNLLNDTDDGQPERLTLLYEDNDNAPFPTRDIYSNVDSSHNLQLQSLSYVSSNNPSQMIPGFKALCGLIQVKVQDTATNPVLFLDVLNTPEAF